MQASTALLQKNKIENTGYADLVVRGLLYDYMQQELESRFPVKFRNRKELKGVIFMVLYSSNRFLWQDKMEAGFKRFYMEQFPQEYRIFHIIKKKGKAALAVLLQQLESHFILDIIIPRIALERPDVIVYTIHDSIVTTSENVDYVARIMSEELEKAVGFPPSLDKEKAWCIENAVHSDGSPFIPKVVK